MEAVSAIVCHYMLEGSASDFVNDLLITSLMKGNKELLSMRGVTQYAREAGRQHAPSPAAEPVPSSGHNTQGQLSRNIKLCFQTIRL
jgi:hypothetical protein